MIELIKRISQLLGIFGFFVEIKAGFKQFSINNFIHNLTYTAKGAPDGLPIPPAHLRYLVIGTTNLSTLERQISKNELIVREIDCARN